jgi:hypothetical protein
MSIEEIVHVKEKAIFLSKPQEELFLIKWKIN